MSIAQLQDVAAHLPGCHAEFSDQHGDHLLFACGLRLYVHADPYGHTGQYAFGVASLPPGIGSDFSMARPASIYTSKTKTAKQIAGDIARRLLPDASFWWQAYLQNKAQWEEYEHESNTTLALICSASGAKPPGNDYKRIYCASTMLTAQGDRVRFEFFSVSRETALKIIPLLLAEELAEKAGKET